MSFMMPVVDHLRAEELGAVSRILDRNPIINEMAFNDLTRNVNNKGTGACGMTAEQVVRAAVIKQAEGYSYQGLAFHIVDSTTYRRFCRIGINDKGFGKSALCNNIKALSPETWEAINHVLIGEAKDKGIEKGREVRTDCTVVSSNIHAPTDSSLLWDSVRVLTRILTKAKDLFPGIGIQVNDHTKRAKRRMLGVMNAKNKKARKKQYLDLLKVTRKTVGYSEKAVSQLEDSLSKASLLIHSAQNIADELSRYIGLANQVIDQTERRIIHGESVPAFEKVVSIFEPHTDIIVKDNRETFYGHKVCLTGGSSNLIIDCVIEEGNPADSTLTDKMLDRQKDIYGRYPLKVALDGGFASADNLKYAQSKGIKDVCFAKRRGLDVEDMCRSEWVYKRLRRFRAGIESGISWLKRCFGLTCCTWKTFHSFKSYVWSSVVSANLLTLARKEIG
jgi:IS5 family transposase